MGTAFCIRQWLDISLSSWLAALLADASTPRDPDKLRAALETVIRGNFDLLRAHAVARRLLAWEAAEEWQTFKRLYERGAGAPQRFQQLISEAQQAGLIYPI